MPTDTYTLTRLLAALRELDEACEGVLAMHADGDGTLCECPYCREALRLLYATAPAEELIEGDAP
jgi:hypothetical protein